MILIMNMLIITMIMDYKDDDNNDEYDNNHDSDGL